MGVHIIVISSNTNVTSLKRAAEEEVKHWICTQLAPCGKKPGSDF